MYRLLNEPESVLVDSVSGDCIVVDSFFFGDGNLQSVEQRSHRPVFCGIELHPLVVIVTKLCPTSQVRHWPPAVRNSAVGSLWKMFRIRIGDQPSAPCVSKHAYRFGNAEQGENV